MFNDVKHLCSSHSPISPALCSTNIFHISQYSVMFPSRRFCWIFPKACCFLLVHKFSGFQMFVQNSFLLHITIVSSYAFIALAFSVLLILFLHLSCYQVLSSIYLSTYSYVSYFFFCSSFSFWLLANSSVFCIINNSCFLDIPVPSTHFWTNLPVIFTPIRSSWWYFYNLAFSRDLVHYFLIFFHRWHCKTKPVASPIL